MRVVLVLIVCVVAAAVSLGARQAAVQSLYSLKVPALSGETVDLKKFEGKVTLVVNVASQCGFTPQYKGLQQLQTDLSSRGFTVLGFPSNDFGGQEPGTATEIKSFCEKNYGVTFPMFSKVVTKPGPQQSPVYKFLGAGGQLPAWNFAKYVIGKDGHIVAFFPSNVTPENPALRAAVTQALAAK
jgi:glutathione peroxidase